MDILEYRPFLGKRPRILKRYMTLLGFLRGRFSLVELFVLFFPHRHTKPSPHVLAKFNEFLFDDRKISLVKRGYVNEDGSFNLFSARFYVVGNYDEAWRTIRDVVGSDQYGSALIRNIPKDRVVIDAGANLGAFSVKAAHDFPGVKIVAFEPSRRAFEILKKNVADYPSITAVNRGLGDRASRATMTSVESEAAIGRMDDSPMGRLPAGFREDVEVITIDSLGAKVGFLKIDTEGYEAKILKGASETIKKWKPVIAMSAYHVPGDKETLPAFLRSLCPGYQCELRHDGEEDLICRVS